MGTPDTTKGVSIGTKVSVRAFAPWVFGSAASASRPGAGRGTSGAISSM